MKGRPLSKSCAPVRHRHPPAPAGATPLFTGPYGVLLDWRCAGHDGARVEEEINATHSVVVTRRGAFHRASGGGEDLMTPASASFWNAGQAYRISHPVAGGDACTVVRLSVAAARTLLRDVDPRAADAEHPRFGFTARTLDGRTYLLHRVMLEEARRAPADGGVDRLAVEELLYAFLHRATAATHGGGPSLAAAAAVRHVRRAQEVIARAYRTPLSLEQIAAAVDCSPYHLSRIARRVLGVPLHRHVVRLRLQDALEQILESPERLSRIALTVGFSSHSHLTEAFRREFAMTPQALRRLRPTAIRALRATLGDAARRSATGPVQ